MASWPRLFDRDFVSTAAPQPGLRGSRRAALRAAAGEVRAADDDARLLEALGGRVYDAERIEGYFAERPGELAAHAASVGAELGSLLLAAAAGALAVLAQQWLRGAGAAGAAAEWAEWRRSLAPRLAGALVAMGPSYISGSARFGQSLASRADLVSAEVAAELLRLQDALPPFDAGAARGILEAELAGAADQGAAQELLLSLRGAVHGRLGREVYRGQLRGRAVAVKVQRPGVRRAAAADAALLRLLARGVASLRWPGAAGGGRLVRADLVGAVDEFCSRLFEELDYAREADNLQRFDALYGEGGVHARLFPAPGVRVPRLEREFCSRRVLVMAVGRRGAADGERPGPLRHGAVQRGPAAGRARHHGDAGAAARDRRHAHGPPRGQPPQEPRGPRGGRPLPPEVVASAAGALGRSRPSLPAALP
ncbi:unnamed protein product [Prorocentrum cordatum]|uniref:ABC1 atypical kinase-like domain-containing protein n=1 Tax=Prorocentrum cordatum TaxID=2364126 RepID=A0ABN9XJJ1_9DINO|nr:unnamed protein product [Polarella glacialis]